MDIARAAVVSIAPAASEKASVAHAHLSRHQRAHRERHR